MDTKDKNEHTGKKWKMDKNQEINRINSLNRVHTGVCTFENCIWSLLSASSIKCNNIQTCVNSLQKWVNSQFTAYLVANNIASGLVTSAPLALFHASIIIGWGGAPLEWFFGPIIRIRFEKEIISAAVVFLAIECEGKFALPDFSSATSCFREIFGVFVFIKTVFRAQNPWFLGISQVTDLSHFGSAKLHFLQIRTIAFTRIAFSSTARTDRIVIFACCVVNGGHGRELTLLLFNHASTFWIVRTKLRLSWSAITVMWTKTVPSSGSGSFTTSSWAFGPFGPFRPLTFIGWWMPMATWCD